MQSIASAQAVPLDKSESVRIIVGTNYTAAGVYLATAFVDSTSYNDTATGNGTSNSTKTRQPLKVRMVNYPWRDTSGYINGSWGCRKMVNVTNETGGTGIVVIRDFEPAKLSVVPPGYYDDDEDSCRIMNCSKEIRVTEVFANKSHRHTPPISVSNPSYFTWNDYTYCGKATIRFNTSLNAGETKSFFVYYNNPLVEVDYQPPGGDTIFNKTYSEINKTANETVWQGFFDSHVDFWWANSSGTGGTELGGQW